MNSKRKCTGCKERYPIDTMIQLPVGWFCRLQCSIDYATRRAQRARQRKRASDEKTARANHLIRRKALKTKSNWMKEAQSAFNTFIRIRDSNNRCISCGSNPVDIVGGNFDAGHYLSRGARPNLRFNTFNCHKQCVKCNRYLSGNIANYRINLIGRIGIERVERLENDHTTKKYTIEYLERIKTIFGKRARLYKKLRGIE